MTWSTSSSYQRTTTTQTSTQTSPRPTDSEGRKRECFSFRASEAVRTTSPFDTLTTIPNAADLGMASPQAP